MALAITGAWETRPDGSSGQSGFFNPALGGTDYSQQAAAVLVVNDAVSTGTTTITSATGGFTQLMDGNGIILQGDGEYEIRAVVSANQITVDRATGTGVAQTLRVGGATALGTSGWQPTFRGTFAPGTKLWVRSTNSSGVPTGYATSAQLTTPAVSGLAGNPVVIEGYALVRGDGGRPIISSSYSATAGCLSLSTFAIVKNLTLIDTSGAQAGILTMADRTYAENIQIVAKSGGSSICFFATGDTNQITCRNCYFDANGVTANFAAMQLTCDAVLFENCTFVNAGGAIPFGFSSRTGSDSAQYEFRGCTFYNNTPSATHALFKDNNLTNGATFYNCIFWNNTNDIAQISSAEGLSAWAFRGCIFGLNTGVCFNYTSSDESQANGAAQWQAIFNTCNMFYDPGSGGRYHQLPANPDDTTLTAIPFNNPTLGDFTLNGVQGGGALVSGSLCTHTFPTAIPNTGGANTFSGTTSTTSGYYLAAPGNSAITFMRSLWRDLTNELDSATITDAMADTYIQRGLEALNRLVRYHWTTDSSSITLVADQQEYNLPTAVIEIDWIEWQGRELDKGDVNQWRRAGDPWRTETDGAPREWAHYGQTLIMRPAPDAAAVAKQANPILRYVSQPDNFTLFGPLQINAQDYAVPVYYAAALWSTAHPESALSASRAKDLMELFNNEAERIRADYEARSLQK